MIVRKVHIQVWKPKKLFTVKDRGDSAMPRYKKRPLAEEELLDLASQMTFVHQQMCVWTMLDTFFQSVTKIHLIDVRNPVVKERQICCVLNVIFI
ncbi:hypothetical protein JTB14_013275 [Gonioctena quinquepunctata]|nr:hypothetical protein JTB14_013275 [Gonioctena quinquepunctata]